MAAGVARSLAILSTLGSMPDALRLAGPALLAFAVGCGALQLMPKLPSPVPAAVGALFILALASPPRFPVGLRRWSVVAAALLAGFAWAAWRAEVRLADALAIEHERVDVRMVGVVAELPREFERGSRFLFHVESVETPGVHVPRRVLLSWYRGRHEDQDTAPRAHEPGDRLRLMVRLKRPHGHVNPGGFDYEAWLLERGIRATGYVRAVPAAESLGQASAWEHPAVLPERWRSAVRHNLQKNLEGAAWAGVVVALAIGDQGSIPADAWPVFAATGTTHLMSISGLHVTMFAALAGLLVGSVWRRVPALALRMPAQRAAIFAGWLAALAYTLLAGAGIPALRTLLMLSVAALAHGLSRHVTVTRVLSLALAAVLLFDPWAVLAVGFWLSFGAVSVLLLLVAAAGQGEGVATAGDNRGIPPRPSLVSRIRHWGIAQWAVTVSTLPMLLWSFQQVSLVSPIANALAIPLVGMVISPLAVAAGLLPLPWLAALAEWPLQALMPALEWLAAQPWALWRQPQPPLWAAILAGAGIVAHLVAWKRKARWRWRIAPLALALPALFPSVDRPAEGAVRIDVLDVGHGLSVLVRTHRRTLLFDGGPRYSAESDAGERIVVPVARAAGIDGFDGVVLSHRDSDHAGGIESARRELPFGWFASSVTNDHPLVAGRSMIRCEAGQRWAWDGVSFEFLSPPAAYYALSKVASNRLSCVLLVRSAGGRSMLITADAEAPEEVAMLAAAKDRFPVDVLQVPHQGSRSSSTEAFVKALAPKVAIVPAGYRNPFGHPHPEVEARYREVEARWLRTDHDGAVRVDLNDTVRISTARGGEPHYWR